MRFVSREGKPRLHRRLPAMAVALASASFIVVAASSSVATVGAVVVSNSPSQFESGDGNMAVDTATDSDWNCFAGTGSFEPTSTVPAPGDCNSNLKPANADDVSADTNTNGANASLSGEVEWVSGQKMDTTQCPKLDTGNNPPKDEFLNVAEYNEEATSGADLGNIFFYGGATRPTNNGNTSGEIEFNKTPAFSTTTNGTTSTFATCRQVGDKLLAFDFLNGGTSAASVSFDVSTWSATGPCNKASDSPPCWSAGVPLRSDLFNGSTNGGTIQSNANGISGVQLLTNEFLEFGINLTQALGLGPCPSFAQQVWESRSSGSSFTSNPEDIEIVNKPIFACGEIKIIKQTDTRGQDQSFSFSSGGGGNLPLPATTTGGVACSATDSDSATDTTNKQTEPDSDSDDSGVASDGTFCLNDTGNSSKTLGSTLAADNSASNTIDDTNVPPGTYSVTEGTEPSSFSFESLTCTPDNSSGSTVTPSTTSTTLETATITLDPQGVVTCLYENVEHSGAILITKQGKYEGCSGVDAGTAIMVNDSQIGECTGSGTTADLGGATFKVTDSDGNTVTGGGSLVTSTGAMGTPSAGTVCIDGLNWATGGTTYDVTETGHPSGYSIDNTSAVAVTVNKNAKCSDSPFDGNSPASAFTDTPLTNISVSAQSQTGAATNSTITCTQEGGNDTDPGGAATEGTASDTDDTAGSNGPASSASVSDTGEPPAIYTCTIVVDP